MKTQKSLFFKTALCLLVACAVLSSGMLFIAASVEGTSSIDGESVTPAIEDVGGSDADLPPVDDPETPAPPATVVDRYLTVTEEEGKTVATQREAAGIQCQSVGAQLFDRHMFPPCRFVHCNTKNEECNEKEKTRCTTLGMCTAVLSNQ